jgi:hypothetical protein
MKWIVLGRKKLGKPALFRNFVKNYFRIMKREKGKDGIDYVRYKVEILEFLIVSFMKVID